MKIAIIGSGFIAETHARTIKALGHDLTTVIGRKKSAAMEFAKKWKIPFAGTKIELALANCDCIHICTPPLAHYVYAKKAILANKHVICEKPLTIASGKAKELLELAKDKKVVAAVNFNVRFHEACLEAKKIIQAKEFSPIQLIHGSYLQEFHAVSDFYSWRYQPAMGGPMRAMTEIGGHWMDLARFWTGLEIVEVAANFANFNPTRYLTKEGIQYTTPKKAAQKIEVSSEDAATLLLKFSNGAIGNVVLSEIAHGRKNELRLEVSGANQAVWWNNETPYQLYTGKKNKGTNIRTNPFSGGFEDTFHQLIATVYQAIDNKALQENPMYPTFEDGYLNAKICEAAYKSAMNNGRWEEVI